ncbi:hypothetical protein Afe04nite_80580 [Asanoa ferruginea]|nr:hypothetical protein Afe04nite_80580 [Asanoa ferruginea]
MLIGAAGKGLTRLIATGVSVVLAIVQVTCQLLLASSHTATPVISGLTPALAGDDTTTAPTAAATIDTAPANQRFIRTRGA